MKIFEIGCCGFRLYWSDFTTDNQQSSWNFRIFKNSKIYYEIVADKRVVEEQTIDSLYQYLSMILRIN